MSGRGEVVLTACSAAGVSEASIHVQWNLYNPTLCGQQSCVRLQRLLDYGVTVTLVLHYYECPTFCKTVGLEGILDCRGSAVAFTKYLTVWSNGNNN